jgi:hypothetical protein
VSRAWSVTREVEKEIERSGAGWGNMHVIIKGVFIRRCFFFSSMSLARI